MFDLKLNAKHFKPYERELLKDTSLHIRSGDLCFLEGRSGTGKTSVLKLLCGLDIAEGCELEVNGEALEHRELRQKVAYVSQSPFFWNQSIRENLELPFKLSVRCDLAKFDVDIAQSLLNEFGLEYLSLEQNATTLSGGEKQRLAIIRAFLLEPSCLLLDEPLAACDETTAAVVQDKILNWLASDHNRAILWVSHNPSIGDKIKCRRIRLDGAKFEEVSGVE